MSALLSLASQAQKRFRVEVPFGNATSSGMVTLHCPPGEVHALASFLREQGAENIMQHRCCFGSTFSRHLTARDL